MSGPRDGVSRPAIRKLRWAAIAQQSGNRRHDEVVDHPAFLPARFTVDDEQPGNVGENVDEGARIVAVGGQPGFWFYYQTDGSDGRLTAVRLVSGSPHRVVNDSGDPSGEGVRLKAVGIEQMVLK